MFQNLKQIKTRRRLIEDLRKDLKDSTDIKEVYDLLFGKWDEGGSEYVVYRYDNEGDWGNRKKTTLLQRFNMLWLYPLFVVTVPFQWLFLGKVGVNTHSKFGKFIMKLIGEE